ncbi:cobalamin-dependent protein [Polyangium sp. 15x6]|uniref:cobalamin-dependent protein n=1 Tax=Polyangium sp. 15x6 TaxID=3042687 RepID=UPI00249ACD9D|nr:cobalamin-dependent protein [Polyangium sp. 15x6]MDI3289009.1 cobalamin-dependent protein [Polyangium sp. 15x6]
MREFEPLVLLAVPESDCHVVACKLLELYLKKHGYRVMNLGVTTPSSEIADAVARLRPIAVFISGQNGHALSDLSGLKDELAIRACSVPLFIGGKVTLGPVSDADEVQARFAEIGFTVLQSFNDAREALRKLVPPAHGARLPEAV